MGYRLTEHKPDKRIPVASAILEPDTDSAEQVLMSEI